jgi:hypothetical protein
LCVFNFSAEAAQLTITEAADGEYACVCGENKAFAAGDVVELEPWGFMLLSK